MSRWLALLMLSGVVGMLFGSSCDAADNTQLKLKELQKKLNAEVLAQPFSVPDIKQVQPKKTDVNIRQAKPRRYDYPRWYHYPFRINLGWYYHHGDYSYGYRHRYYRHY